MQEAVENDPKKLSQVGWQLLKEGEINKALQLCEKLLNIAPNFDAAQYLTSKVVLKTGKAELALKHADLAIAISAKAEFFIQKAQCQWVMGQRDQVRKTVACAVSKAPTNSLILVAAGSLLTKCEDIEAALEVFLKAKDLEPDNVSVLFNVATTLRYLGNVDEAEAIINNVIKLNPEDDNALLFRSDLRGQTAVDNHIDEIEKRINNGCNRSWNSEVNLYYALAKETENVGDYKKSFSSLSTGSALRRKHLQYNITRDVSLLDDIRNHYHSYEQCSQAVSCDSSAPIFIVGMPRTGTTMIERILGCHSEVVAVGELDDFSREMINGIKTFAKGKPIRKELMVEASLNIDFKSVGEHYVNGANQVAGSSNRYFVDKLPFNFLYCGLINRALPNAKIIHMTRDPMDTCYAVYKTLFGQAYPFSYDLDELATYYIAYRKLMDHWHKVMPGKILNVCYEDVIDSPELEAKKMLEYCQLPWQPECLDFHRSTAASTTASAAQVRRPIYKTSVQKWRHFEEPLQPLQKRLQEAGLI
ncbi:sulfotransferase [Dasania marina]|uniref:sulfotransferase n=1 Tax=Dasania marina TaxID=471499 RepID=UPI0030D8E008|tara:strand:+ start:5074 stop:6663 length:1590 start_codon:yes stop_codon:yes gene_type:complete